MKEKGEGDTQGDDGLCADLRERERDQRKVDGRQCVNV